jgi:hypothetical protein
VPQLALDVDTVDDDQEVDPLFDDGGDFDDED